MTDIEAKALALLNEVEREQGMSELTTYIMRGLIMDEALCRAIEQHEAFKQEVSDAAEEYNEAAAPMGWEGFDRFIIPKAKPDPLVEVLKELVLTTRMTSGDLRAALEVRGLEIREKGR